MDLVVQLEPALAEAVLAGDSASPARLALQSQLEAFGVALSPMHPGIDDPALRTYFRAAVPEGAAGEEIAAALRASAGVVAAYLEPPVAPATP